MGDIGSAMVLRLLQEEYQVTVYNRTRFRAEEAVKKGAAWADTLSECLADADYIFTKVSHPQDVEELYLGEDGVCALAPKDSVLIDLTGKSPELSIRISEEAETRGVPFVDASVIGGAADAVSGTLTILTSGEEAICRRLLPVLKLLGNTVRYTGEIGVSQQLRLASQIASAGILTGISEAVAYSGRVNLDKKLLLKILEAELNASSSVLSSLEGSDAQTDTALSVRHMLTDFQTAREEAQGRNLHLDVLNTVTELYERMNREGLGHAGTDSLVRYYDSFSRNGTLLQSFEWYLPANGKFWKELTKNASSYEQMGFTALWLPPAFKALRGKQDVGYGVYDVYDLGEFDQKGTVPTKYGTREEYQEAIHACHDAGLHIYPDIVLNHKLGADRVEEVEAIPVYDDNRNYGIDPDYEIVRAETIYDFPGRAGQYSDFTWDHRCFSGVRNEEPSLSPIYRLKDHEWSRNVDTEFGNFDFLMGANIDHSVPEVVQELKDWGAWYASMTELDGVRLDAVKHISSDFYREWLKYMRETTGRNLFAVGEYWNGDVQKLLDYLQKTDYQMSLFDVPLHFHFYEASHDPNGYDLRYIFRGTLTEQNPIHSVTFTDNHDTQPGQSLASPLHLWFRPLAYAMILLRESGYPCVFYGDLKGIPHDQVPAVGKALELMLKVRRQYAYGRQNDYLFHPQSIGWTREQYGLAVLLSSRGRHTQKMFVGKEHAGKLYRDVLGNCTKKVRITRAGYGDFSVENASVSVWLDEALEV